MAAGGSGRENMILKQKHKSHPRRPVCACTAYSCNKLWLLIYTLIFLIVGLGLLVIGAWVEYERRQYKAINNHLSLPVALLVFVGLFIALNALFGIAGTIKESSSLLKLFLVVTVLAFLVQVAIGVLAFVFRERIPNRIHQELQYAVEEYSSSWEIKKSVDILQSKLQCCGYDSYGDYEKNDEFSCVSKLPQACGVPRSCCKRGKTRIAEDCGFGIRWNGTFADIAATIHVNGCSPKFLKWMTKNLDIVGAVGLGFAIPQIIGMLLIYFFIRRVHEFQVWYRVSN